MCKLAACSTSLWFSATFWDWLCCIIWNIRAKLLSSDVTSEVGEATLWLMVLDFGRVINLTCPDLTRPDDGSSCERSVRHCDNRFRTVITEPAIPGCSSLSGQA